MAETLRDVQPYPPGQTIVRRLQDPSKGQPLVSVRQSRPERRAVAKITGKRGSRFTGRARVFTSEEAALKRFG